MMKYKIQKKPLDGKIFGKLTVISFAGGGKNSKWNCICECGKKVTISRPNLMRGTKSCGCDSARIISEYFTTHGMTNSNAYRSWTDMKTRCTNKKNIAYKNYGKRGIKIYDQWVLFENFLSDMGNPENGMSLERIDVNGNYCPENCKWIPKNKQGRNTRKNIFVEINGEKITASEFKKILPRRVTLDTCIRYIKRGIQELLMNPGWVPIDTRFKKGCRKNAL